MTNKAEMTSTRSCKNLTETNQQTKYKPTLNMIEVMPEINDVTTHQAILSLK